jgi:hypothetical protein
MNWKSMTLRKSGTLKKKTIEISFDEFKIQFIARKLKLILLTFAGVPIVSSLYRHNLKIRISVRLLNNAMGKDESIKDRKFYEFSKNRFKKNEGRKNSN